MNVATQYGKTIIGEHFLDPSVMTIPPIDIGGIAGYTKNSYIFVSVYLLGCDQSQWQKVCVPRNPVQSTLRLKNICISSNKTSTQAFSPLNTVQFAVDDKGVYGNDGYQDEHAQKVAGHDLKVHFTVREQKLAIIQSYLLDVYSFICATGSDAVLGFQGEGSLGAYHLSDRYARSTFHAATVTTTQTNCGIGTDLGTCTIQIQEPTQAQ